MRVEPEYAAVGTFFTNNPMFRVPKYQRSYAWEIYEVDDYVKDLSTCYEKRKAGTPINHFFGGMVSVEKSVVGVVRQHEYELVDGQQRLSTFVLTIGALISVYKEILVEAVNLADTVNETIINRRIDRLTKRFIEFEQEVNRETINVDALIMSTADEQFFKDIIRQNNPTSSRVSHDRIEFAYKKLREKILSTISTASTLIEKIDNLEIFEHIIDDDFSMIHIITYDKKEAYKLFQVLNDRGKSLTEGDLLRAKTLEILESYTAKQDSAERLWDDILKDPPKIIDNYLRWIYSSHKGSRAGSNTLFDDFLNQFYPQHLLPVNATNAQKILDSTLSIQKEIIILRKLSEGTWPFQSTNPITAWDRNRLTLLIRELGFTVTIPLLLSCYLLGERKFSDVVQILEKFLFRYKTVSNEHIEAVVTIFHAQSVLIRANPTTYNINTLKIALKALLTSRVNDVHFKSSLDTMSYKEGGGNKPLKYFLMTLEHYKRWYNAGATGVPICNDKTRVYDFSSTTIEHVYPRNAHGAVINASLEPFKNEIENLTFMGPTDNVAGGNDDFATKKPIFSASSVSLNIDIGNMTQWTNTELTARKNLLKDMACKIFTI
nr:DUF262 domain-containing HNH endonuclease family protein [uncultured Flavobacterium sp.]